MSDSPEESKREKVYRELGKGLGAVVVLVLLMLWLSGAFISKVEPGPPLAKAPPETFNRAKVERRSFPLIIEQVGTVRAQTEARVASQIMAQVKEVLVKEGDRVTAEGDTPTVLARLDDREIRAKLQQAESQVLAMEQAQRASTANIGAARAQAAALAANQEKVASDYRRYQELFKHRAATGQQLEHAKAQLDMVGSQFLAARKEADAAESDLQRAKAQKEQAQAAAEEARVMLSHTIIYAPFSGQVIRKMVDPGDMAAPGQPLFFLETSSLPVLHAFVAESYLPSLRAGQQVDIEIDALNRTLPGEIKEIVPQADPATRTLLVKVGMTAEPDLVNGMFGRLLVPCGDYEALVIPTQAVRQVGQLDLVDVVDAEGYPVRRFVTLGKHHDGLVEVLSGLQQGEEVRIP